MTFKPNALWVVEILLPGGQWWYRADFGGTRDEARKIAVFWKKKGEPVRITKYIEAP